VCNTFNGAKASCSIYSLVETAKANKVNPYQYAVANKQIIGCITAKEAADIHFFSRKQFTGEEKVDAKARQVLTKLYAIFELIDTLGIDCQNAIAIENKDYEDAIIIAN